MAFPLTSAARPLLLASPVAAATGSPQFAVLDSGVRMPDVEMSAITPAVDQRTIVQVGAPDNGNAALPTPAGPIVPVHPRKQSRH